MLNFSGVEDACQTSVDVIRNNESNQTCPGKNGLIWEIQVSRRRIAGNYKYEYLSMYEYCHISHSEMRAINGTIYRPEWVINGTTDVILHSSRNDIRAAVVDFIPHSFSTTWWGTDGLISWDVLTNRSYGLMNPRGKIFIDSIHVYQEILFML